MGNIILPMPSARGKARLLLALLSRPRTWGDLAALGLGPEETRDALDRLPIRDRRAIAVGSEGVCRIDSPEGQR